MSFNVLASRKDIAGMNISRFIHSSFQKRLKIIDETSIYSDEELETNDCEYYSQA
ncbi:MAG: hypothetical protein ACFE9L_02055 [Candidatus Hodarchaeota archaeon]